AVRRLRVVGHRAGGVARRTGRRRRRAGARRRRRPPADPRPGAGRRRRRRLRPGPTDALGAVPRGDRRVMPAPTDRGTWRLVARRDFWVRLRERSFLVSTLINIGVISILVLARASSLTSSGQSYDLGYIGSPT